jgi:hypothetical protein
VGSAAATNCSAGTFNDQPGMEACSKCAAGSFQDAEGATSCRACKPGAFCLVGAFTPLQCDAGRYGTATNLSAADQCQVCPRGHVLLSTYFLLPTTSYFLLTTYY